MADLWPYLIYTFYSLFINKEEEIHLSPSHEINGTHGAYITGAIRYIFFLAVFLAFPDGDMPQRNAEAAHLTCICGKGVFSFLAHFN